MIAKYVAAVQIICVNADGSWWMQARDDINEAKQLCKHWNNEHSDRNYYLSDCDPMVAMFSSNPPEPMA